MQKTRVCVTSESYSYVRRIHEGLATTSNLVCAIMTTTTTQGFHNEDISVWRVHAPSAWRPEKSDDDADNEYDEIAVAHLLCVFFRCTIISNTQPSFSSRILISSPILILYHLTSLSPS